MTTPLEADSIIGKARARNVIEPLLKEMFSLLSEHKRKRIPEIASKRTRYLTILAENIRGEQNASAILRTAEALGIQDVHLLESQFSAGVNRVISKGSRKWLSVHHHKTTARTISEELKDAGYKLVATVPEGEGLPFYEFPIDQPIALLMGNEQDGLSREILPFVDASVTIPMFGFVESFNVSVATGIIAQDLVSRIRKEISPDRWKLDPDEMNEIMLKWAMNSVQHGDQIARHWIENN